MSFFDRWKISYKGNGVWSTEPPTRDGKDVWSEQAGSANTEPSVNTQERTFMDPKFVNVRKVRKGNVDQIITDALARAATGGPRENGPKNFEGIFKGSLPGMSVLSNVGRQLTGTGKYKGQGGALPFMNPVVGLQVAMKPRNLMASVGIAKDEYCEHGKECKREECMAKKK